MPVIWGRKLRGLNKRQLKHGLDRLTTAGTSYPPNLSEFYALCTEIQPTCHRPFLPAPQPRKDHDAAQPFIVDSKAIASGRRRPTPEELDMHMRNLGMPGESE